MKKFIVTEEVLIGILKYLHTRPYQEVVNLIQVIQKVEELKEEETESGKELR